VRRLQGFRVWARTWRSRHTGAYQPETDLAGGLNNKTRIGGRYEGSKEHSSGIDRCWLLGLVRTCPGAEALTGVRDRSYLQPTQGSGEGGRYGVWHSSRSREFGSVGEGPIGPPGPGANHLSAT